MMSTGALFIVVLFSIVAAAAGYVALSSRHRKSSLSPFEIVGRVGSIERGLDPEGFVLVAGELWPARARGGRAIERGRVRVVGASGAALEVEAVAEGRVEV